MKFYIVFHALTGCDYASSFKRKGKIKSFQLLESNDGDCHVEAMRYFTPEPDAVGITAYFCTMYSIWI